MRLIDELGAPLVRVVVLVLVELLRTIEPLVVELVPRVRLELTASEPPTAIEVLVGSVKMELPRLVVPVNKAMVLVVPVPDTAPVPEPVQLPQAGSAPVPALNKHSPAVVSARPAKAVEELA